LLFSDLLFESKLHLQLRDSTGQYLKSVHFVVVVTSLVENLCPFSHLRRRTVRDAYERLSMTMLAMLLHFGQAMLLAGIRG
jgi:hypothetical protein